MRQAITLSESHIDHLVVAASSLEEGIKYIEQCLGVTPQTGGKHVKMGTHNALLKISDKTYLEVIATDPGAAPPNRQRWFIGILRPPPTSPVRTDHPPNAPAR